MARPAVVGAEVDRKEALRRFFDGIADSRHRWRRRNRYFYEDEIRYLRFLVPPGSRVLEIGCGTGDLLAALEPSEGVGVDLSEKMVAIASRDHPHLDFRCGDIEDPTLVAELGKPYDYVVMSDTVGYLSDLQGTFRSLHHLCTPRTRIILSYFSQSWRPLLTVGERLGLKMPDPPGGVNWLSSDDIAALLDLADIDVVSREWRMLVPRRLFGIGSVINRTVGTLPVVRRLSLRDYVIARPAPQPHEERPSSATVVIPCRNEEGNIAPAVERLPRFTPDLEVIFVEGGSQDGTVAAIEQAIADYPEMDIKLLRQQGRGKGDAVRTAFAAARGDVLLILDADLTVPPEELPKFYDALVEGKGEFVNGTRLVYPQRREAMRPLNLIANHAFARLFSWLINQRVTDTLCGTKALRRADYQDIEKSRAFFGQLDPFGDFDLMLGAAKLGLNFVEVPIRYHERTYGKTQISRFRDGWQLVKMFVYAWRRMKSR